MPIKRGHLHSLPQHWYLWPQTPFWISNLISCGVINSNGFGGWFGGRGGHTRSIYEPAKLMPPGLQNSLQWNKLTLSQKVLPSLAFLPPTTGFEKLFILNIPENRRIAFTDFSPIAQYSFHPQKNCDLSIYFQEEMKSRGFT